MARYLMTHSLLSAWQYAMSEDPYADATTERDPMEDFMKVLRREPRETTEAMQNGLDFEALVYRIARGVHETTNKDDRWYDAACQISDVIIGGTIQLKAKADLRLAGTNILLFGVLDVLKAGTIYDVKFSKSYERGKYFDSTQHPAYFYLIPEAREFTYLVSNGSAVYTETYRREETRSIEPVISEFLGWLDGCGLMPIYREKWVALT
jgi:hypothetical protein